MSVRFKHARVDQNVRKGGTAQGGPQKCVRGRASGATVRSGHVLRVSVYSIAETRHLIRIKTGLDTSRIGGSCRGATRGAQRFRVNQSKLE